MTPRPKFRSTPKSRRQVKLILWGMLIWAIVGFVGVEFLRGARPTADQLYGCTYAQANSKSGECP